MDHTALHQALLSQLISETELAHGLSRILSEENDALKKVDPEQLDAATLAKQNCVESLAAIDAERRNLCTSLGLPDDNSGMEKLLQMADDPDESLHKAWHGLVALLEACREANQRNGVVVNLQRRRVGDALSLLHNDSAKSPVYDASGDITENDTSHVRTSI